MGLNDAVSMSISRLDMVRIERALAGVDKKVRGKVLRKSIRAALKPMLKSVKANAKRVGRTGLLANSIGIRVKYYRKSGTIVGVVGPRRNFKRTKRVQANSPPVDAIPSNYAHLVEFGTRVHYAREPFVRKVGAGGVFGDQFITQQRIPGSRPRPFMRPAFDANKNTSQRAMAQAVKRELGAL